jgi:hypothetical protein
MARTIRPRRQAGGTTQIGAGSLGNPGSAWHVKGSGNFFGNGASDILWQNDSGEANTGR